MTAQALEHFLHAQPFRPFTLITASGKSYRVPHPEFVAFGPSRRIALVFTDEESFDALDVRTITEIKHGGARARGGRRAA